MTVADVIERTHEPVTTDSLARDLGRLGVGADDVVLVHSSLSSLGWVNGGAVAVIQALLRAVGPRGTLVMPTHSTELTDPANWRAPPVPSEWIETTRATMPPYDPATTPTSDVGRIAELFRTWPGAVRSDHPSASLAALGPLAEQITKSHPLDDPHGPGSPLGALYRLGAKVLLIGVDFDRCTCLHLAEHMLWPERPRVREGAPLLIDGGRQWVSFETLPVLDNDHFLPVGADILREGIAAAGPLGEGRGIIGPLRSIVDHAMRLWEGKPIPA